MQNKNVATIAMKRKEGESANSLMYRFNKKVQQSGLVREVRRRQFRSRPQNKGQRRTSALYRADRREAFEKLKRHGMA